VSQRKAREGRNPRTNEKIKIPALEKRPRQSGCKDLRGEKKQTRQHEIKKTTKKKKKSRPKSKRPTL